MTRSRLSGWLRNSNRNLQHAIADRQSNFQACSFNHSDISPFTINDLRLRTDREDANCVTPRNVSQSLTRVSSIAGSRTRSSPTRIAIALRGLGRLVRRVSMRADSAGGCCRWLEYREKEFREWRDQSSRTRTSAPLLRFGAHRPRPCCRPRVARPARSDHPRTISPFGACEIVNHHPGFRGCSTC